MDTVLANSLAFIPAMAPIPVTLIATPIVLEPEYRAWSESWGGLLLSAVWPDPGMNPGGPPWKLTS